MVNNNGIPIEVKKPFETVYELKNEIPSFEEFMKTYENDNNLNYGDLNNESIDGARGYGPCTSDYCSCSNYELRQQLRSLKQQTKEDIDNFWEKFKDYDGRWENYRSNVNEYFNERDSAGAIRSVGGTIIDAIPIPFISSIHNSIQDAVDGTFEKKYENNRSNYYSRVANKYSEIRDWYYRIRGRYC